MYVECMLSKSICSVKLYLKLLQVVDAVVSLASWSRTPQPVQILILTCHANRKDDMANALLD